MKQNIHLALAEHIRENGYVAIIIIQYGNEGNPLISVFTDSQKAADFWDEATEMIDNKDGADCDFLVTYGSTEHDSDERLDQLGDYLDDYLDCSIFDDDDDE